VGRIEIALIGNADLGEQGLGLVYAFGAGAPLHVDRRLDKVFEDRLVRPEIEALEHHSELRTHPVDLLSIRRPVRASCIALHADRFAGDGYLAGIRCFQQIDAAQERRFSRSGRAENGDDVAFERIEGDALEDLDGPEALVHVAHAQCDGRSRHCGSPAGVVIAALSRVTGRGARKCGLSLYSAN
jgi:hypothetical protein